MANGYTWGVRDGTVTSFREFAIQCARAFGANILMRDMSAGAPVPTYEPSTYHKEALERAKADLYDAEWMTIEEIGLMLEAKREEKAQRRIEVAKEAAATKERYEAMLVKVRAWTPPTPDHMEMKTWMLKQIQESIEFESDPLSNDFYNVPEKTAAEYRAKLVASAKWDVDYHKKGWDEEQENTRKCNEWNKALFESLGKE